MLYTSNTELPDSVRNFLPTHAQDIYRASFNNAHKDYHLKKDRRDPNDNLEEICHKVAWAAVKQKYHKGKDGNWTEKK